MPLPKRQHSKQRSRKRRTHWKIQLPNFSVCPQCKRPVMPHRVCPFCGHYKGLQIVEIPVREKKRKP